VRRRNLIAFLGSAAITASVAARAQQPARVARIGILSDIPSMAHAAPFEPPLTQGLQDLGWVEGRNLVIERRYAEKNRYEILPSLAAELVRLQPDVIVAIGTAAARAAKGATQTIPIVFARAGDPVGWGLVCRPGRQAPGRPLEPRRSDCRSELERGRRGGSLFKPRTRAGARQRPRRF